MLIFSIIRFGRWITSHIPAQGITIGAWIGLCIFVSNATAADTTMSRVRESGAIRIGFRGSAVPFSYLLPNAKKPIGFGIEICERIAASLQRELKLPKLDIQYVQVDGQNRFQSLKDNKIDMECGNTTNSRERREKLGFAFSVPYYVTGTRYLVRADSGIHDTSDLRGRTIAVAKGATGTTQIKKEDHTRSLNLKYEEIETRAQAFDLLKQHKIDAFAQDDIVLYNVRSSANNPSDYKIVGNFITIEPLAIMFRGEDTDLKKFADLQMTMLMESGEFKAIYAKWFERPIPPNNVSLDMPMNFMMKDLLRFPTDKLTMYPE
jgi:glutamate/aspartate transport system substrate-binding protein